MKKMIRKYPNKDFEICKMHSSLEASQKFIGGYIESIQITNNIYIYCNENGKFIDLDDNINILLGKSVQTSQIKSIVGNILIVKVDEEGDIVDISENDLIEVKRWYIEVQRRIKENFK